MRNLTTYRRSPMTARSAWDLLNTFDTPFSSFAKIFDEDQFTNLQQDFSPHLDLQEVDGKYEIHMDIPGMKKEDIKIDYENNILTISGERSEEKKSDKGYYERRYGKFSRSLRTPHGVDIEKAIANYENGVLHLSLPVADEAKSKTIKVS